MNRVFRDDECRVRTDDASPSLVTIEPMAYDLMRKAKTADSLRLTRKVVAWDDEFLAALIAP